MRAFLLEERAFWYISSSQVKRGISQIFSFISLVYLSLPELAPCAGRALDAASLDRLGGAGGRWTRLGSPQPGGVEREVSGCVGKMWHV